MFAPLVVTAALALAPFAALHAAEPARPNILFIYTDDQDLHLSIEKTAQ